MASKKDDEVQAKHEAELANLQNQFLRLPLAAQELASDIEEEISPAIVIDETAEPLAPSKSSASSSAKSEDLKPAKPMLDVSEKPAPPKDLGAAEFLLSGMMPTSTPKPSKPVEPQAFKQESQEASTPTTEPLAEAKQSLEEPRSDAIDAKANVEEPVTSSTERHENVAAKHDSPPTQAVPETTEAVPPNESKQEKKGMFSKAKSLFSKSKKDKKEES